MTWAAHMKKIAQTLPATVFALVVEWDMKIVGRLTVVNNISPRFQV